MIERINTISVNSGKGPKAKNKSQPQFKGLDSAALGLIQACEKSPMVNVAVLDLSTAIVPRTVVESETNPYAGLEAFRRESSGLIINCMIPGVIVMGLAKLIQSPIMGGDTRMGNCWADEDTIKLITKHWEKASDSAVVRDGKTVFEKGEKAKVYNTISSILKEAEGVDGDKMKAFAGEDFHESIKVLTEKSFVQKYQKADRKAIKNAYKMIAEKTHATENIRFDKKAVGFFSQNLESVLDGTPRILRELVGGKTPDINKFATRAKRLLTAKSLMGLGVILPLAIAAQPINRWITARSSGVKGAPIYKDFGAKNGTKELSPEEKSALRKQKVVSIGSMIGVALLSMMKMPTLGMLKFKGLFPSMDQARIISTATFASRMGAAQDKNDLREATFRDIATFSSFYFLGDYVAKGIATQIQKRKGIQLINVLKEKPKDANVLKQFWHWAKHTAIKSSDEVVGKTAKNMRSWCQLGNIAFSLVALGIVIPKLYRKKTGEAREKELKEMGVDQKTIRKYYPPFRMNSAEAKKRDVYKSFSTSLQQR